MRNEKVTAVEYILLTLLAFVFIFPIFWMVKTSLSPATECIIGSPEVYSQQAGVGELYRSL